MEDALLQTFAEDPLLQALMLDLLPQAHAVEMHASLGAHIPISVHPSSFVLLSTATRTQPPRELSDAQLGTPDRVLRRSRMSGYSLPLPASVAITWNSFGSVWTSSHYSAQPPAPNPHETSPMHSLVHPIGSCEGPACVAHPYPFLSVSVTRSSIKSHYYTQQAFLNVLTKNM